MIRKARRIQSDESSPAESPRARDPRRAPAGIREGKLLESISSHVPGVAPAGPRLDPSTAIELGAVSENAPVPTVDDDFVAALTAATSTLQAHGIPYLLIGGLASELLGRERRTRDIDVFVKRQDATRALDCLAGAGFETERTNDDWIFKAFLRNVQVDVIFVAKGFHLDDEMIRRGVTRQLGGATLHLLSPEDLLVLKAVTHDEQTPRHWFDALGILGRQELDWDYLAVRARHHPTRVLSLLCYGRSLGLRVPSQALEALLARILEIERELSVPSAGPSVRTESPEPEVYLEERLRNALASDPRTNELGLSVHLVDGRAVVTGLVASEDRRQVVSEVIGGLLPGREIRNELQVLRVANPAAELLA